MVEMFLRYNTATEIDFFMPDDSDPWSGKPGLTGITVQYKKQGQSSFTTLSSPTITEIGNGWYKLSVPATLVDAYGFLIIRFSATGAKTQQQQYQVVAFNPYDSNMGLVNLDVAVSSRMPSGNVTVGGYASGQDPATLVWSASTRTLTSFGTLASDIWSHSTRTLTGNVTVGGYASGQNPANYVLLTPANKLATDASGRVTVGSNADKTGYTLTSGEHTQIQSDVQSGLTAQGYTTARAPKLDNLDATVSSRAAPGDAMTLTTGERSNIATAVWNAASRTLTSFGTLVSDVASAVWGYATRTLTALGNTLVDEVWNRLRSATSRPVGSFGYYLDAQVSSGGGGGGGGSGFIGPRTITFQVRDAANQPVPGALVVVHGVGAALTNATGQLVAAMPEGAFTVSVVGKDGLLFDSQTIPATGDATLQFIGYTRVPPTATDPGTCVVYADVTASCAGTLTIVELPRKLSGGKWLVGQTQQKSSSAGRITFDAVPWGATVRVVVPAAKVDTTFVVPEASSYAV